MDMLDLEARLLQGLGYGHRDERLVLDIEKEWNLFDDGAPLPGWSCFHQETRLMVEVGKRFVHFKD